MEEARLGRWHTKDREEYGANLTVEMEEARLGRWHLQSWVDSRRQTMRRNGRSPFRALTQNVMAQTRIHLYRVEMEEARLGRWHTNSSHSDSVMIAS